MHEAIAVLLGGVRDWPAGRDLRLTAVGAESARSGPAEAAARRRAAD
ncbi:hypothetical protein HET69_29650 [Streptomyces sp. CJ_13]|nr:hypothetical protein [Streptomyces sp. ADI95-16]MBT1188030.1 hypothetical protein [Streptomyces sp. CJ_13]